MIREQEATARKAQVKADAIDAAVLDLKAVNPNIVIKLDTRTPVEVIANIEKQGQVVADALDKLKTLL
jgi:type I restriction enzyme M protein